MNEIGKLEYVNPREAWRDEARDFTPWLAEHLDELGETLGLKIEYEGHEVSVEQFSADILARNPTNDARILIENQLERSDHKHVGQIMTYLAGLEAEIVIWIATDFTEPHLAAIKWLNEHTSEPFSFFAVKLSVVRIEKSPLASVFEAVARPNNWERQLHAATRNKQSRSPRAEIRKEFWNLFLERHPEFGERGMVANGSASQWLAPSVADDLFVSVYFAKNSVGVFLRGSRGTSASEVAERFVPIREEFLELTSPEKLFGDDGENHPGTSLRIDTTDKANWDEALVWMHQTATKWLSAADQLLA